MLSDPRTKALLDFRAIWGVGPSTARRLWQSGYRSIEDIRQRGTHGLNFSFFACMYLFRGFLIDIL